MSSFGKLYAYAGNPRARVALVAAKYEGLELDVVTTDPFQEGGAPADFLAKFPQGLVPAFEKDDFKLTESIAIASYIAAANNKAGLLGSTKEEAAEVTQWMSFANTQLLASLGGWYMPLLGKAQYNKSSVDASKAKALKSLDLLEKTLQTKTFLVGHRVTLADIFITSVLIRGFENVLDAGVQKSSPNVVRYFKTVVHQPAFFSVINNQEPVLAEKAIVFTPPKKEAKPAAAPKAAEPKAAKAPKAKEVDEDDEPAAPAEPKAKHPIEALGPAKSFPLDEFKRQYSNNETPDAIKWLEEHFDPQEYSLWKAEYKYPEELTQVFMSSNLVTGFHSRLEGSRKYIFGSAGVYGKSNDNLIQGVYLIRGSDYKNAFDVAPDYESYNFTPLDFKADRDFIDGCWGWTNTINGKEYADGKIFK